MKAFVLKLKIAISTFCLIFLLSLQAMANADRTLKIASFPFPPLLHESVNGTFSGTMGETVKALCEEANLKCEFQILPLKRAYHYLKKKMIDGLVTIKIGQFNECCIASNWMSPWSAGFFSRKTLDKIPQTPDQVLGQSLIVVNGMRSPYVFIPKLDEWKKDNKVKLSIAKDVYSATLMFNNGRADYLWGSDDFNWYFDKIGTSGQNHFLPLMVKPVVVWLRKEKQHLMDELNKAYVSLNEQKKLDGKNLLVEHLMKQRYVDAPFNYTH